MNVHLCGIMPIVWLKHDRLILFHNVGPPSVPLSLLHNIEAYGTANYSVIVQWEAPNDTGGVDISNYTTTLHTLHREHVYTEQMNFLHLILLYNQVYTFQVVATNCMGTGPPVYLAGVYSSKSAINNMPAINTKL